jgi:Methyltransferase domain
MAFLNSLLRPIVPGRLLSAYRNYNRARAHRRAQAMTAREVFTDIYQNNRWGGEPGTFCSGSGSVSTAIVTPYVACIKRYLASLGANHLTVVDLGCGDFSVGRQLADDCDRYVGVDIVESLVRHNEATFGTDRVSFQCLDIIEDNLPPGDICFVRQVMQHLSNEQILRILPKLDRYRWTFITEHQPSAHCLERPNLDKPHGGDIRVHQHSGVYLEQPPFSVPDERLQLVLEVPGHAAPAEQDPGVIRTFLLHSSRR